MILFSCAAMGKKEILPCATKWMELEGMMLSEISQTKKDKYCMISVIYGTQKSRSYRNRE